MITIRYSEYEEPEEPPFTLDDIVKAASELMLRFHIDFNEALKYLLEQGLPINEFLKSDDLDSVLDDFIEEVERQKEEIHSSLDIKGVIKREDKKLEDEEKILNDILKGEPETTGVVREAVRNRSESAFYRLRQAAKNLPPSKDRDSFLSSSEKGAELTAFLVRAETFFDQYGKRFFW